MKYIALTMGNPEGIGPEILLKSWKAIVSDTDYIPVYIGAQKAFSYYNDLYKLGIPFNVLTTWKSDDIDKSCFNILDIANNLHHITPGKVSVVGAKAAYDSLITAIDLVQAGSVSGIVTAPISKDSFIKADIPYTGHTDILLLKSKTQKYSMTLYYDNLFVMHLTGHKPLREAFVHVTSDNIIDMIITAYKFGQSIGIKSPRIGVPGLNPHAGENGLLGHEELTDIIPAITYAHSQNIDVSGPVSPDAIFEAEYRERFDIIIALYHDQGHIPIKAIARDKAVQLTVGLPFIRTSPAHGTAFDIAGKGSANPQSLIEAYELAIRLDKKNFKAK